MQVAKASASVIASPKDWAPLPLVAPCQPRLAFWPETQVLTQLLSAVTKPAGNSEALRLYFTGTCPGAKTSASASGVAPSFTSKSANAPSIASMPAWQPAHLLRNTE